MPFCRSQVTNRAGRVLRRQARAAENDAQHGQADAVRARAQRPRRRPQPAFALGGRAQLLELRSNVGRQRDEGAGLRAVGECDVLPQVLEHAHEVRLAAAIEAADPDRRLLGLVQVAQERGEHPLQAGLVLARADERLQLVAQDGPFLRRLRLKHLRHAVVGDDKCGGIAVKELAVL